MLKAIAVRLSVITALSLISVCAHALADEARRAVNIPPGELSVALDLLARQSGAELMYRPDQVRGLKTPGAKGELTAQEAVIKLLKGTRLEVRMETSGALLVIPPGTAAAAVNGADQPQSTSQDNSRENGKTSSQEFRVAHLDPGANPQPAAIATHTPSSQEHSNGISLEEIVVTAQKREERLIDVPISIVALTAEELQERNITNIDELATAIPGMATQSDGSMTRQISLRGISNRFGSNSSLIGMYLDEASVTGQGTSQLDLRTYDLERVEVLRGPQGTLYGDGSAGGTIRFITKNPRLNQFSMDANVAALFTQTGAPSQHIEAVGNVPLVEDQLGVRIAGTFAHEGGWIDEPAAERNDINSQNLTDLRVKGLWQPVTQFTANAMAVIHRNDAGISLGEDRSGNFSQAFDQTTTPHVEDDFDIYNLTLTYDTGVAQILSTSSYIRQVKHVHDTSGGLQILGPPGPANPPFLIYQSYDFNNKTVSQELRVASVGATRLKWTVGGFYRRADSDTNGQAYFGFPGPLPAPPSASSIGSLSKSWAAFADADYEVLDRLTFGAGIRYFKDEEQYNDGSGPQTGTFSATSPRAYAEYKVSGQANLYASAAKGFRSGGFNPFGLPSFDPETVWTYELGSKWSVLEHRLNIDTAIFLSNYCDYQVVGVPLPPAPTANVYSNAGSARLKGVEWDVSWRVAEQWTVSLNGDYLNTRFTQIKATDASYNVGDPLDLFPKYAFTASLHRDFAWNSKPVFARLDYSQQGRETYRNRNAAGPTPWYFSESDVIRTLNFHADIRWSSNLGLGFFAQNLLNNRGSTDPTQGLGVTGFDTATRPRPRTYGIDFSVNFD